MAPATSDIPQAASTPQAPPAEDAVPMEFPDGSQAMVPRSNVLDAMYDGRGELLHPMQFPDGSQAMVKHSRLAEASNEGHGWRLDTQPIKAATWQEYLGTAFGAATDTTIGAETGEKSLGQDVTQGLNETTSGHWVKGPARVANAALQAVAPALGAERVAPEIPVAAKAAGGAVKAAGQAAEDIPAASLANMFKTAMNTTRDAEVAAGNIESQGAAKLVAIADKGVQEAQAVGNTAKMIAYNAAKRGAQLYKQYSNMSTWLDKTIPGAPLALKAYGMYELASHGYHWFFGDDQEDARKTLFGEK